MIEVETVSTVSTEGALAHVRQGGRVRCEDCGAEYGRRVMWAIGPHTRCERYGANWERLARCSGRWLAI